MATTDWNAAAQFQEDCPHTFLSMQTFVMAMSSAQGSCGGRSPFNDHKDTAIQKFEQELKVVMVALVLDGQISVDSPPSLFREKVVQAITSFAQVFPNWQDAYKFGQEYFVRSSTAAEQRISALRK